MYRTASFITCLLVSSQLLFTSPVRAELLDRFVVQVNKTVILESDVRTEQAIIRHLAEEKGQSPANFSRKEIISELVDREILLFQARRFISNAVTRDEISERVQEMEQRFGGAEELDRFLKSNGISETTWRVRIRNQLLLEKFLDQRVRAFVRVTENQIDEYIVKNSAELGLHNTDNPAESVGPDHPLRNAIGQLLQMQAFEKRREELLNDLKRTASIHYTIESDRNDLKKSNP